jgi:hypothetical protein
VNCAAQSIGPILLLRTLHKFSLRFCETCEKPMRFSAAVIGRRLDFQPRQNTEPLGNLS